MKNILGRLTARALPCLLVVCAAGAAAAPAIFRQPTNEWVVAGQSAAFNVGATGLPPVTYQWRREGVNLPGATNADFIINAVQTNHAGRYTVLVSDAGTGSVLSSQAMLTVAFPVVITVQPQPQFVAAGGNAVFSVSASGSPLLRYQWKWNGLNLSGATNQTLLISNVSASNTGLYSVRVWNGVNSVDSQSASLTTAMLITIVSQPTNQTLVAGSSATFNVVATGAQPLQYQWLFNGAALPGATNAALTLSNVAAAAAGPYLVRVWNAFDAQDSAVALLNVLEPVVITAPPGNRTVESGQSVTFSVTALGSEPLAYQWFFENSPINGATNQTFTLSSVTPSSAGSYTVRVSNVVNALVSERAMLTVTEPPVILTQPLSQTVNAGSNFTISVLVGGATPLTYQWIFNEQVLSNATGATLTRSSARPEHAGDYRVIITNPYGTLSSAVAHLDVVVPVLPFEDQFARVVNMQNTLYLLGTGSNSNATRENLEPLHDGEKAVRSVWLAWTAPASGVVRVNTLGSDFDTVLAIYSGTDLSSLTPVESDDDSGPNHTSALSFNAVEGTTYRIAIAGYLGTSGNIGFELELTPRTIALPIFLSQPRNYSVAPGGDADLNVSFNSEEAVQIEWLFMGNPVANITMSNTLRSIDEAQVGRYRVKLTTPTHVLYSRYAEVQINSRGLSNVLAQDKIGRALDYAQMIPATVVPTGTPKSGGGAKSAGAGGSGSHGYTTTQIFSTAGATVDPGEPVHCGLGGGHSTWFVYQAETNGTLRIDTEGSSFDTVLAVYIGPGDSYSTLTNVACDNNSGSNGLTSVVLFQATQGVTYYIAVDGVGSATGTVKLHINLGQTVSMAAQPASQTVPSGSNVTFTAAANGMTNYTYQWRFGGTNLAGATNANFTRTNVPASLAGSYDVVVKNPINSATSSIATLTVYSSTLNLSGQPPSQSVSAGATVNFSVTASGAGVLRYQWRFNGGNLSGATNSALPLVNVQAANAGSYAVNVTDNNGSLLSSNAVLTIVSAPVITLQPVSRTFGTGEVAQLTAAATGTPLPVYQWLLNDAPLAGQISGTIVFNNFNAANEGTYSLRASNSAGVATSAGAELLLNAPLRLMNSSWSNGVFSARLVGVVSTNYLVQCSTNATTWATVATNTSPTGLSFFTSPNTNSGCWVFRAITP